jgi:Domain of unknown function (DUF3597)
VSLFKTIQQLVIAERRSAAEVHSAASEKSAAELAPAKQRSPGTVRNPAAGFSEVPPRVDIETALDRLAARAPQALQWRTSVIDLLKVVGVEPSYRNRKDLAIELGYQRDLSDSVVMSIWLHKELLKRLAKGDEALLDSSIPRP